MHADPWYNFEGRESDIATVYTHADGSFRRPLDVVRYHEAIADYKYLAKLEQTIATAKNSAIRDEAQMYLRRIVNYIEIGSDVRPPWEGKAIDMVRAKVAEHILALTREG